MSKKDRFQTMLNWFEKEKQKDKIQLDKTKNDFIKEIKSFNKDEFFKPKPKLTLWQKIRIMIWGH